jgi:hypothetical protein
VRDKYPALPAIVITGFASIDGTKKRCSWGPGITTQAVHRQKLLRGVEKALLLGVLGGRFRQGHGFRAGP